SRVLARFCAQASIPATQNVELQRAFSDLLSGIDFPLVVSDDHGVPRAWRAVGVDPGLVPAASLDSLAAGLAIAPPLRAHRARASRPPPGAARRPRGPSGAGRSPTGATSRSA